MNDLDYSKILQDQILEAYNERQPIRISGYQSKAFFYRPIHAPVVDVTAHRGILNYEPTELIITARAGTPLSEIDAALAEHHQMLAFEPPYFADNASLGGTIACGLSGPRRPWSGSARDFVLGTRIINGKGEILSFGGEVMKNVAGYDVSRLMTGAMGTLGLLLDISLKVLPRPQREITLSRELDAKQALQQMLQLSRQSLPISALCHDGEKMYLRLCGAEKSVLAAKKQLGGIEVDDSATLWHGIREHRHRFFHSEQPLWRLSLPAATPIQALPGKQFIDWGGAQRWLYTELDAEALRAKVSEYQGHATLFRHGDRNSEIFHPLLGKLKQLQMELKLAMDPHCILNPTMLYSDF
ncbi:MAG: glycolate oxidase subunit GlcE [Gammaproteobacteria bacterium]|nr:glycolate oxidase subunit GlcE [Gammaproteobacteria bacterium]MDH5651043.1 glycolate oxidase subunit GlcE [Gammaproteobacteria bacterium]